MQCTFVSSECYLFECYLVDSVYDVVTGNLALSRALGDFVYKRDSHRPQDQQIVIGTVSCDPVCDVIIVVHS